MYYNVYIDSDIRAVEFFSMKAALGFEKLLLKSKCEMFGIIEANSKVEAIKKAFNAAALEGTLITG